MKKTFTSKELKEYVDIIYHNSDLLLKLINDVLDISSIESDSLNFHFGQKFQVLSIYDKVLGQVDLVVAQRSLHIVNFHVQRSSWCQADNDFSERFAVFAVKN